MVEDFSLLSQIELMLRQTLWNKLRSTITSEIATIDVDLALIDVQLTTSPAIPEAPYTDLTLAELNQLKTAYHKIVIKTRQMEAEYTSDFKSIEDAIMDK